MSISGVIEAQVRANTLNFEKGMKQAARTLGGVARGMTSAITAVTASASAMEKSWTGVGLSILGSFAAGGPIAAGLSAVGAGIGYVIGRQKELAEASEKADAAMRKELDSLKALRDVAQQRLEATRALGRAPSSTEMDLAALIQRKDELLAASRAAKVAFMEARFARDAARDPSGERTRAEYEMTVARSKVRALESEMQKVDSLLGMVGERKSIEEATAELLAKQASSLKQAEDIEEGRRKLAAALFDSLSDDAASWWQDFVDMGTQAMESISAGSDAVTSFGSGFFLDKVEFKDEMEALGEGLGRVENAGRDAFTTIGNAIDFAALRAGRFGDIMSNVAEQLANLALNKALGALAGSLFAESFPSRGAFGPEDAIPGGNGRVPIQDWLDNRSKVASVNMTVVTQDAASFRRSERQIKAATQRAVGGG